MSTRFQSKNDASRDQPSGRTSSTLLWQVAGGNQQAWKQLADVYGPLVFHWCRRSGLASEDAGDVMQNVFTSVARRIDQFAKGSSDGSSFRGWLRVITRNAITDHYRQRARQIQAMGGTDAHAQLADLPDILSDDSCSHDDRRAESQLLHRVLQLVRVEFQEKTWQAFHRAVIEGHATSDIAEELGISNASVRQAKSRVLRRLREELGEAPPIQ